MKLRNLALYLTVLFAVSTLSLFAQSTASSGSSGSKATPASKSTTSATPASQKLDINAATKDQLDALPGIGSAYSQKIIDGRPYNSKRDLLTRKIVPEKTYEGIQDKIIAHHATGAKGKSSTGTAPSKGGTAPKPQ